MVIKSDCAVAINMIKAHQESETMSTLIRQITIASMDLELVCVFTKKEANMEAVWMSKSYARSKKNIRVIDVPNSFIFNFFCYKTFVI